MLLLTASEHRFFPGTLACVSSIDHDHDHHHPDAGVLTPGDRNTNDMSISLHFCPTTPDNRAILRRRAEFTNRAEDDGPGPCPGRGGQGIL